MTRWVSRKWGAGALCAIAASAGVAHAQVVQQRPIVRPAQPQRTNAVSRPAEELLRELEARASMLLSDIASATGWSLEDLGGLEWDLDRRIGEIVGAQNKKTRLDAESAWRSRVLTDEWTETLHGTLDAEASAALFERRAARSARLHRARHRLTLVLLAAELRLREPQVEAMRDPIDAWLSDRGGGGALHQLGDVVLELSRVGFIAEHLEPGQLDRISRMRFPADGEAPRGDEPGDDLTLGRGRYPEDEYYFEAAAVGQFFGWPAEDLELLYDAAAMLGREARRSSKSSWREGSRFLSAPVMRVADDPLWNALVLRECERRGTPFVESRPIFSGDRDTIVQARADVVLALLDVRLLLDDEQREALAPVVHDEALAAYRRGATGFGAIDGPPVWRALRLEGALGRATKGDARRSLTEPLREVLRAEQLDELGLRKRRG